MHSLLMLQESVGGAVHCPQGLYCVGCVLSRPSLSSTRNESCAWDCSLSTAGVQLLDCAVCCCCSDCIVTSPPHSAKRCSNQNYSLVPYVRIMTDSTMWPFNHGHLEENSVPFNNVKNYRSDCRQ